MNRKRSYQGSFDQVRSIIDSGFGGIVKPALDHVQSYLGVLYAPSVEIQHVVIPNHYMISGDDVCLSTTYTSLPDICIGAGPGLIVDCRRVLVPDTGLRC